LTSTLPSSLLARWFWPLAAVFLVLLASAQTQVVDPDLFWHLAHGDYLREHGLHRLDPFACSGLEQVAYYWLFDYLVSVSFGWAGWLGVLGLGNLVLVLLTVLLYRYLRQFGHPSSLVFAVTLLAMLAMPGAALRPYHLTFAACLLVLSILQRRLPWPWEACALFSLTLFWANVHIYYFLALPLVVWHSLERWWGKVGSGTSSPSLFCTLLSSSGAVFLATLCTPFGLDLYTTLWDMVLAGTTGFVGRNVIESKPFDVTQGYAPAVLILAGLLGTLAYRRRHLPSPPLLFLIAGLSAAAVLHQREVPFLGFIAAPLLLRSLPPEELSPRRLLSPSFGTAVLSILFLATLGRISAELLLEARLPPQLYPVEEAAYVEARELPGPLLNHWNHGGYLIHRLYPRYKVFIDGRINAQSEEVLADYLVLNNANPGWEAVLERRRPGLILWPTPSPLISRLDKSPRWKRVFTGEAAVVFVPVETSEPLFGPPAPAISTTAQNI